MFSRFLVRCGAFLLLLIAVQVMAGILSQYRWYFPANFEAAQFLAGREAFFLGSYKFAFYAHILCGPLAILLGSSNGSEEAGIVF